MSQIYAMKRGDTFSLAGTADLPAATGAWVATSTARNDQAALAQALTVTLTPPVAPATKHTILIEGQTTTWPVADVLVDVKFADASAPAVVLHSETLVVRVGREVT